MPAANCIPLFLIAENRLLREALTRLLAKKSDVDVVAALPFSSAALESLAVAAAQVLLLDSHAIGMTTSGAIAEVRAVMPDIKVVLFGMEEDQDKFLRAVRQGVAGYVLKDASAAELASAVRVVATGGAVCPPTLCRSLFEAVAKHSPHLPSFEAKQRLGLTRREQQLVLMIGRGLTNKEIAGALNLSEQTVKNHIHRMLRKMGAGGRLEVVQLCRSRGFLSDAWS